MRFTRETAAVFGATGGRATTLAKRRAARANGERRRRVHPLFSSRSEEWATPRDVFARLDAEFDFDLDPCATADNATCATFYTREDDGLRKPWHGHVFMNPPFGATVGRWMAKAWLESRRGALVVCLVPARTDTAWWHDYAAKGEVRFIRGRLRFGRASSSAPFPSAVVIFRPAPSAERDPDVQKV